MGKKNRHSKDKLYITAYEWSAEYGGKKTAVTGGSKPLPFDHCALSLGPFETPVATPDGVIFDLVNIMPYIRKHKCDPVTGNPITSSDIIRLNMQKNQDGKWYCPVTCKVFNDNSHIVVIKSTGSVFSYEAVHELNIKPKNYIDLLTNEPFSKSDIITLLDPQNTEHQAKRDINNFIHMKKVRDDHVEAEGLETKIRSNPMTDRILKELEEKKVSDAENRLLKRKLEMVSVMEEYTEDVEILLQLQALTNDVNPGQVNTSGNASSALTSSSMNQDKTSNSIRLATPEELREARYRKMRQLDKKAYIQIQTTHGNINIEIYSNWIHRASYNFIKLCQQGYYNNCIFHRLIPGFMIQTGDPTGTGKGGESIWNGMTFKDEFDSRLLHTTRGIVSMANSGVNSNKSQFFITFAPCSHLDYKHTIFGKVVGGMNTLDRMENIGSDTKERPLETIQILSTTVFSDPLDEVDELLITDIRNNIKKRQEAEIKVALPKITTGITSSSTITTSSSSGNIQSKKLTDVSSSSNTTSILNKSHNITSKVPSTEVSVGTKTVLYLSSTPSTAMSASTTSTTQNNTKEDVEAFLASQQKQVDTRIISSSTTTKTSSLNNELSSSSSSHMSNKKPKTSNFGNFSSW